MDQGENYVERLRAVFDLCDGGKQGYISVDHFVELAREHFGADEGEIKESIHGIVGLLDPEQDGKIYFQGFCEGVKQILEIKSPTAADCPSGFPFSRGEMELLGSQDTLVSHTPDDCNNSETQEASEVSTFNEYDVMTDDDAALSSLMTSSDTVMYNQRLSEDDGDSAFSTKSSENQDNRVEQLVLDDEERYEYSSQYDTPHSNLHSSPKWANKQLTSNALASQLYRSATLAPDYPPLDDMDGVLDLTEKVRQLEGQLQLLQEKQQSSEEKHCKLKEENASHVERIHVLEEQLRDVEMLSEERLLHAQRRHHDMISKTDKEKADEIDILSHSLKHVEKEYFSLKEEAPRLRLENEKHKKVNSQLEVQLTRSQTQLRELADEQEQVQLRLVQERRDMKEERRVHSQLVDELSREVEDLRTHQATGSTSPPLLRSQRRQLQLHISQLKEENVRLREQYDEVQAQFLSSSVAEGRSLLQDGDSSLAEEINSLPRDELMVALKKEQESNKKLRDYIDRMVLKIIERSPSLLEIPDDAAKK